ncbi:hypothetical protein EVAR_100149_1 [Eumeta japonica]|uniref:Uncharacterized protein n=1 Tax=Eumeta variegata TaxID=151549 RepID=A0A4C1ZVQ3_EUMVA|nr:hypothetical protein EVAR_100149_1 [Eumeta japonica]
MALAVRAAPFELKWNLNKNTWRAGIKITMHIALSFDKIQYSRAGARCARADRPVSAYYRMFIPARPELDFSWQHPRRPRDDCRASRHGKTRAQKRKHMHPTRV